MMLSEAYLQKLLDESLRQVTLPRGCAIGLEGSLAEGFGNATSDIDFIAIDEGDVEHKTMPILLFIDGRRIEVRVRSQAQVVEQFTALRRRARHGQRGARGVPEDLLDRCQRLKHALPLRGAVRLRQTQEYLPDAELARVVGDWFAARATQAARCATLMLSLGLKQEACSWARVAVNQGAKVWAAAHHETYLSPKWTAQQLARIAGGETMLERFKSLDSAAVADEDPAGYVARCIAFAEAAGLQDVGFNPDRVSVASVRGVTTWQLGSRVHVMRNRDEIFVLNPRAAQAWRALALGVSLPELIEHMDETERRFVGDLHRIGLVSFSWRGAGRILARPQCGAAPSQCRPVLSIEGARLPADDDDACRAHLIPMAPQKFASAGLWLMWSNIMIENAFEDAYGALEAGQWSTFENSARRILREACLGILSAFGVTPLPHTEEACACLAALADVPAHLRRAAIDLSFALRVRDESEARACLEGLTTLVRSAREVSGSRDFPSCFQSADEWRDVLKLGYDWTRMGAYLDADFPYDEVRDLMASAGARPVQRMPAHLPPANLQIPDSH